ncbi:MAG: DUF1289 domain-containing protein [Maritimibacter sp.]|nr:DUF1289 domain-containing protein [Maritimibacter sp.]
MTEAPLTPCVNICVIHPDAGLCIGCLRTRDEIAAWGRLDNAARREIMAGLDARAGLLGKRRGGRAGKLARRGDAAG